MEMEGELRKAVITWGDCLLCCAFTIKYLMLLHLPAFALNLWSVRAGAGISFTR